VARIIVLDSGPLGDACRKRGKLDVEDLTSWRIRAKANGAIIAIPEIADYEVRRGLLLSGAQQGIERLDDLRKELGFYIPISTASMRRAAELWADARRKGYATADDKEIDADVILAAQALLFAGLRDSLVAATYNARHLSRYVDAHHWEEIES
jgi:predicted nucleic acid-binding protein